MADTGNHAIREVDVRSGAVRTLAGDTGLPGYSNELEVPRGKIALEGRLKGPTDFVKTNIANRPCCYQAFLMLRYSDNF